LAFIACSSEGTGQTSAAIAGGASHESNGKGGGAASGDAPAPANGGCTYTQGYWKNHSSAWPVMSLTIGGVAYTEQQLLDLFNSAPKGDASLILGHQLIAALLNIANGAVPSATVQQAMNDAQTWMVASRGSNAALPYGVSAGSAAGQQATALTQTLDDFNSGLAGTPHCGTGGGGSSGSSSSSSGSGSGAASGGPDAAPACEPLGGSCNASSDCCSLACNNHLCALAIQ
jgi:hypothetical protein